MQEVIIRQGRAFIALIALKEYLLKEGVKASTTWNNKKHSAVLSAGKHTLRFTVRRKTLRVNNKHTIKMPAAPFLISGQWDKYLYVPLAATMRALNGTATVDMKKREATLAL